MVGRRRTYIVSTVLSSSIDVQFKGHATSTWYSHEPLDALQKPRLGRTVEGNDVMRGVNVQVPMLDIFGR